MMHSCNTYLTLISVRLISLRHLLWGWKQKVSLAFGTGSVTATHTHPVQPQPPSCL